MSVGRFFSASIAPRWKCSSLLLTASLLWEINLSVSEAPAGASNHKLCFLRCVTSRAWSSRNAIGDQWAGNQTLRKSTGQSAPNQSVIVVCWSPWITASPGLALTWEAILHRVHPTWAGTFVLAALVAVFPSINFILLDSDCLPVTLFEAADLWKEGYLVRFPLGAMPTQHPLHRKRVYHNDPRVVYTQHRVDENRVGQGVLLVTEPFSELNAGLIVVFGSSHPLFFSGKNGHTAAGICLRDRLINSWLPRRNSWKTCSLLGWVSSPGRWGKMTLPQSKKQYWIQSRLALSPLMATCTQYSLDFCLAWALLGEWTSRILFPVLKGPWPRHGHAGRLLPEYQARSPCIVAWARACFEQGALPSLLLLQGLKPIFTLPGDKMFQSTGVQQGRHRPPLFMHTEGRKWGWLRPSDQSLLRARRQ